LIWDTLAYRWEEGLRRLHDYVELNGHARVRQRDTINGYAIGKWVNKQRDNYAEGTLDADR
jgi:hypothetical protein